MKITRKFVKVIDFSLLGAVVLAGCISAGFIMLSSKGEHDAYWEEKMDYNVISTPVELNATLKEGKHYYKNNKAVPSLDDFDLNVKFLKYGTTDEYYVDKLDHKEYSFTIKYSDNFYAVGGDIKIGFKKLSQTINVELIPVEIERIEVTSAPYTIYYRTGTTFDPTGMKIASYNNDGSSKDIASDAYTIDVPSPLTKDTNKVTISYQEGTKTCTTEFPITVTDDYELGTIKGLETIGVPYVENGYPLSNAHFTPLCVYTSGNKVEASPDTIEVVNGSTVASLGKVYNLELRHKTNPQITTVVEASVRNTVQGENTVITGGKIVNETEYIINNAGSIVSKGSATKCAGDFGASVLNGRTASVSFTALSATNAASDLTLRCANSYLYYDSVTNLYSMKPLKINTIADLFINDETFDIQNDVILAGCGSSTGYAPLYNIYSEFTFKDVPLKAGYNKLVLKFKTSTEGVVNYWGESPSTMNIDYLMLQSKGIAKPDTKDIVSIAIDPNFVPSAGQRLTDINVPVYATSRDETTFLLDRSDYDLVWDTTSETVSNGQLVCTAKLKEHANIKDTVTFNVENQDIIVQCESALKAGTTKVVNESNYEYTNGVKSSAKISVVSGMDNSTTNSADETSLAHYVNLKFNTKYRLYVRCGSSNETKKSAPFSAPSYKLNDVCDIYVNNVKINYDATIPAFSHSSDTNVTWWSFTELLIGDFDLHEGTNIIKIVGKHNSSLRNVWNEIPVPKMDYIKVSR